MDRKKKNSHGNSKNCQSISRCQDSQFFTHLVYEVTTCTFYRDYFLVSEKCFSGRNPIVLMGDSKTIYLLQALNELKETRKWAALHVADNCCFHYRRVSSVNCWLILKCSNYFKMSISSDDWVFFFFSFLFSIFHPPAAYAQNFSGINLQKNKFWFQYWHLSSVEGKLTYRCYFSNPKNPTLLVNALCLSNTIIKEGMLILLNFTILTRIGFRYFLLNRILMLLNVNIFFYSCFWYLLYCCTNFFVDTSTHEFFILFYWTLLSSVSLLE